MPEIKKEEEKNIGLYEMIRDKGQTEVELDSKKIRDFIKENYLTSNNLERLEKWKEELEFWEEYAKIYRNLEKARPYYFLTKTISRLIEPNVNEVWLDVGCGPAKISRLIWERSGKKAAKIIGVDIILKPAQETLEKLKDPIPLELRYANIGEKLPFPNNYFDGVVANLCLSYVIDFEGKKGKAALIEVLKEMFRILKPGGELIWSTPKKNVRFEYVFLASIPDMLNIYEYIIHKDITRVLQGWRILKHALEIQKKGQWGVYTFLSKKELETILNGIGFKNMVWKKTFARQVWVNRSQKTKAN
jgi:ubiquinone/menaquinone biosynthesis C-methylase UbiE